MRLSQAVLFQDSAIPGVKTSLAVHLLAEKLSVEMPICAAVYEVIHKGGFRVQLSRGGGGVERGGNGGAWLMWLIWESLTRPNRTLSHTGSPSGQFANVRHVEATQTSDPASY